MANDFEMKQSIKASKLHYVKGWLGGFLGDGYELWSKEEIKTKLEELLAGINQTIKENEY